MKNFKIFTLIIILLITALFVGCIALTTPQLKIGPGSTTENGKNLKVEFDIPYFTAEGIENGCGCAAGAMIMNYYNYLVSPSDIEPYIMVPENKLTETFGLLPGIMFYIWYYDYNLKTKLKIMKIEQIKGEIDNGNPVAVWQYACLPRITENWHYRVIHGYDDEQQEFIISCSLGEDYRMSYEEFISLNVIEKISHECPDGNLCLVPVDKCPSLIIETKGLDIDVDVVPKEGNTPHKVNCVGYVRAGVAPFYYQWDFGDGAWSEKGIGIEYSNVFHTYTNSGKFVPVLYVEDSMGRKGKCKAEDVIVIFVSNQPPEIHSLIASPESLDIGGNSTITCDASDPDGDEPLTYDWSSPDGGTISGSGESITWTAPGTAGMYPIICTVSDGKGEKDSKSVSVIVNDSGSVSSIKIFLQSGSSLNNSLINISNPTLSVLSGQSISGILKIKVQRPTTTPGNIVPLGYTPTWGPHSSSYVQVDSWISTGTSYYDVSINLTAPSTSGTYYLIFASRAETGLRWVMSQTNWTMGIISWDDGNDIADLTESDMSGVLSSGYCYLNMLEGGSYHLTTYGITYIKINVTSD